MVAVDSTAPHVEIVPDLRPRDAELRGVAERHLPNRLQRKEDPVRLPQSLRPTRPASNESTAAPELPDLPPRRRCAYG